MFGPMVDYAVLNRAFIICHVSPLLRRNFDEWTQPFLSMAAAELRER